MARRRAHPESLELLLDTICNTFGGVLFLAILVVMLLQQTGKSRIEGSPSRSPVSPEEVESLAARLEESAAELARLRANRASQELVVGRFAPDEVRALLAERSAIRQKQDEVEQRVDELRAENAAASARIESTARENARTQDDLKAAVARNHQAKDQLERERETRVERVRLPVVRTPLRKQEIGMILRYGRLYIWHRYGPGHVRLGLNTDDFAIVSEEGSALVTRPIPTRGVPLDDSPASREAVLRALRSFDPGTCYLSAVVRPDSYAAFRHLRNLAIELGFEYRILAGDTDSPVADRGGSGKVQ